MSGSELPGVRKELAAFQAPGPERQDSDFDPPLDPDQNFQFYLLEERVCPPEGERGLSGVVLPLGPPVTNEKIIADSFPELNTDELRQKKAVEMEGKSGFRSRFWLKLPWQRSPRSERQYRKIIRDKVMVPAGEIVIRRALEVAGVNKEEVDILLVPSTGGPDGLALGIKERVGLVNVPSSQALQFDNACPGGVLALWHLDQMAKEKNIGGLRVMVAAPEVISPSMSPVTADNEDKILFSDVAAAVTFVYGRDLKVEASGIFPFPDTEGALKFVPLNDLPQGWDEQDPGRKILSRTEYGYGWRTHYPRPPEGLYCKMNGKAVYKWTMERVLPIVVEFATKHGFDFNTSIAIPHQANGKMIEAMRRRMVKDYEYQNAQLVFANAEIGNNGAASNWTAFLEALRTGKIQPTEPDGKTARVMMYGFGAGLLLAVAIVRVRVA